MKWHFGTRSLVIVILGAFTFLTLITPVWAGDVPAKKLFGGRKTPAKMIARSIGGFTRGCLAGGEMLPKDGPAWQAMRLSRNRNWGHPKMVSYVKKLATESQTKDGWPGLLVGDLAQPRGGPMLTGHRSHQIGLDADIWMMPMPKKRFSWAEREQTSAVSVLAKDKISVDPKIFKPGHVTLLKRAASYPEVARIFVHPAIKKALCDRATGNRSWLAKVRPWWGHHYHFHVRLKCPRGSGGCRDQKPPPRHEGCGGDLKYWLNLVDPNRPRPKVKKKKKKKKRRALRLADLPGACRTVLNRGGSPLASGGLKVPLPTKKPM